MRNWTRRERGLGAGIVLMAVAALVVPAWAADGGDEGTTGTVTNEATGNSEDMIPAAVTAERGRVDECMTDKGFGPGSQAGGAAVEVPAPGAAGAGEIPPLPDPDPAFKKAADDCGLPPPGEVFEAVANEANGRGDNLCPLPPPPALRDQGQDDSQDEQR